MKQTAANTWTARVEYTDQLAYKVAEFRGGRIANALTEFDAVIRKATLAMLKPLRKAGR